jgi:hypothetical protein
MGNWNENEAAAAYVNKHHTAPAAWCASGLVRNAKHLVAGTDFFFGDFNKVFKKFQKLSRL